MRELKLTHIVVYGDREHFANLAYLTGFDPRFEEALLIVGEVSIPLVLVGNECESYLDISSLHAIGRLRHERFQSFSLLNQPRDRSRPLREIFAQERIGPTSRVGCVGSKYFSEREHPDARHAIDIPGYLVDTLRELVGRDNVVNVTELLMHPGYGLRTTCTPYEIAYFEYSNVQAAESGKRMILGLQAGVPVHGVVRGGRLNGTPNGWPLKLAPGDNAKRGASSPRRKDICRGQPLSM